MVTHHLKMCWWNVVFDTPEASSRSCARWSCVACPWKALPRGNDVSRRTNNGKMAQTLGDDWRMCNLELDDLSFFWGEYCRVLRKSFRIEGACSTVKWGSWFCGVLWSCWALCDSGWLLPMNRPLLHPNQKNQWEWRESNPIQKASWPSRICSLW